MCIADCPGNAIISRRHDVRQLEHDTAKRLGGLAAGRKIVAYICGHYAPAAAWSGTLEDALPGVMEVYLPSMSRLSAAEILHAIENGADGVIVAASSIGADRYPNATERIRKRVGQVRQLLDEVGLGGARVQLVEAADQGRAALREAMAKAAEAIAAL
jgi:coenzyme F420-reducing hydrogenase delta subunit